MKKKTKMINPKPVLKIYKSAYEKIQYACKYYETEIGGFGILKDRFTVTDFVITKQECDVGSVEFDSDSFADFIDEYVNAGYQPWQLSRVFVHTHPSGVTQPSGTDYETLIECFGDGDFSIMLIFVKSGEIFCELHLNEPNNIRVPMKIEVIDEENKEWEKEIEENVSIKKQVIYFPKRNVSYSSKKKNIEDFNDDELDNFTQQEWFALLAQEDFEEDFNDDGIEDTEYFQ